MGLNNLSIEEKRTWYSAQIQRLRDRKIEETRKNSSSAAIWTRMTIMNLPVLKTMTGSRL